MVVLKRGFHSVIFFLLLLALAITKSTDGQRNTLERFIQTRHGLDEENTIAFERNNQFQAFLKAFDHLTKNIPRSDSESSLSINQKPLSCQGGDYSVDRFDPSRSGRRFLTYTISQSAYRTRPRTRVIAAPPRVSDPPAPSPAESPRVPAPVYSPEDVYLPIGMFELAPVPSLERPSSSSPPPAPVYFPTVEGTPGATRVLVVIGTCAGIFVAVGALLLCCLAGSGKGRNGNKDDKPLLALSSTTYSGGSSRNSSMKLSRSDNKEANRREGQVSTNLGSQEQISEAPQPKTPLGNDPPESPLEPPQPPPPPPPPAVRAAPAPPSRPPPAPPKGLPGKIPSNAPKPQRKAQSSDDESGSQKAKLKPFFWDKTVLTNTDQSMVWNEISSGSFQFNEEMIETLFGYSSSDKNKSHGKKDSSGSESPKYVQILEAKKAQNLSILLRALNVTTEEVVDALRRGNELPVDLIQILLKVAPTTEEELKLRLYSGEPSQLGPAERFLKVVVDIPYAFQRLDSLLFMCSFEEESSSITESLTTLEVACNKVRSSRLFLKLLEAVLKTGNRMNDGTYRGGAQAFRLDTLLKLADVRGTDGKTTLLHFVVNEIIRSEGDRALRSASPETSHHHGSAALGLAVVSGLTDELEDVRRAAAVDADAVAAIVARLGASLARTRKFLDGEMSNVAAEEGGEFSEALVGFVKRAEGDVARLAEREKRTMGLVKSTTDYFHGSAAGKDEGLRLFVIVRDFLVMVEKVCREVKAASESSARPVARVSTARNHCGSSSESVNSLSDFRQRLFPASAGRRVEDDSSSSSDDES